MKDLWLPWLDQGVIAVLNGVVQGLLFSVFVWLMLWLFRRINASTRYLVWMGTLGCLAAFPVIHFLLAKVGTGQDVQAFKSERSVPAESTPLIPLKPVEEELPSFDLAFSQSDTTPLANAEVILNSEDRTSLEGLWVNEFVEQAFDEEILVDNEGIEHGLLSTVEPVVPLTVEQEIEPNPPERIKDQTTVVEKLRTFVLPAVSSIKPMGDLTIPTRLPYWSGLILLLCFMLGVLWNIAKLGYDLWLLKRLKHEATFPPVELIRMLEAIQPSNGMRSNVTLKTHPSLKTPLAVGFSKPMILMPEALVEVLDDSAKEQILKHELAHLLRYDDWTNLFQRMIQAVYFFHPAVWMVSRRADVEREIACDDYVLEGAVQAKAYALMLTQFANRERDRHLAAASAVWNKQSQIKERIEMLLDHHRNTAPRPARLGTGLLTIAALFVAALTLQYGPRVALADDPVVSSPDAPAAASADSNSIFENEIEEPRSKNEKAPTSDIYGFQGRVHEANAAILSSSAGEANNGSRASMAQNNATQENPYHRDRGRSLNRKPVIATESAGSSIASDALPSRYEPSKESNRRSASSVRSTQFRPLPGTARVEMIAQAHSHPVEVQIMSDHESDLSHVTPKVSVRSHAPNPLERRIAKLENLVETLLKNAGSKETTLPSWVRRSDSNDRSLNTSASDHSHGGDVLFGHAPGMGVQPPKVVAPSFSNQQDLGHRKNLQRARELEQKRYFAVQTRAEIENQRAHLQEHMESLKKEMAKLEAEMRALEMQAKQRKIRQTFNEPAHLDAFSSDAFAEEFEHVVEGAIEGAFDALGGVDASSSK